MVMNNDVKQTNNGDFNVLRKDPMHIEGNIRWEWHCGIDGSEHVSYSKQRHTMDVSKNGNSGVDLEEGYARCFGDPIVDTISIFKDGQWQKFDKDEDSRDVSTDS